MRVEHTRRRTWDMPRSVTPSAGVTTVPGSRRTPISFRVCRSSIRSSRRRTCASPSRVASRDPTISARPVAHGQSGRQPSDPSNLTTGNPNLKPQHAWNYDLLLRALLPVGGSDLRRRVLQADHGLHLQPDLHVQRSGHALDGLGTRPENGGSGHICGIEGEWAQRLVFLPGAFAGLGFDANYTHTSRARWCPNRSDGAPERHAPCRGSPRTSPTSRSPTTPTPLRARSLGLSGREHPSYGDGRPRRAATRTSTRTRSSMRP